MFRKKGEPKISTKTQTRSTRAPMARYWGEPKGSSTPPLPLHRGTICGAAQLRQPMDRCTALCKLARQGTSVPW